MVMRLTDPFLTLGPFHFSGKDLILVFGGLFLLAKATYEIHHKVTHGIEGQHSDGKGRVTLGFVLAQVVMIDVVFSLDSVITAVGLTPHLAIMVAAVLSSVGVMLAMSGVIVRFIERHPAVKILALAFLIMIGALLWPRVPSACRQGVRVFRDGVFGAGRILADPRRQETRTRTGRNDRRHAVTGGGRFRLAAR